MSALSDRQEFEDFLDDVRTRVDALLPAWLAPRVKAAHDVSVGVGDAADALTRLCLRGGKRLRPAFVAAAFDACGGDDRSLVEPAMIAVELLQTYLLIHDDWMDDDDTRRGGPSVHVVLRERLGSKNTGDAFAILAGDLACAYAQEALLESNVSADRTIRAAKAFARVQSEVVTGQLAEMFAAAPPEVTRRGKVADVETVHALKTASYTVTGPLAIGALLAGADDECVAAFVRFGEPLGIAFQLRDDWLGVFGDPKATGKPVGSDLRNGKRTSFVTDLAGDRDAQALAARVLARPDASDADVEALVRLLETSGAKARVEARIDELGSRAVQALDAVGIAGRPGRRWLAGAIAALKERVS